MFERRESSQLKQKQFRVDTRGLPRATPNIFSRKFDEAPSSVPRFEPVTRGSSFVA
jgi:hypothetical protein